MRKASEGTEGRWVMMDIKKFGYAVLMLSVLAMPFFALALNEPTPPIGSQGSGIDLAEIQSLIERIAQFLIVVGVIVAVIFIIWGGVTWMAAGGNDDAVAAAKNRIKNGVFGAAVVLGVGVILQTLAKLVTRTFFG